MLISPEQVGRADLSSYLEYTNALSPEFREAQFRATLKLLNRVRPIDSDTRILEIGTGSGWFQVMCLREALDSEGLDLSPQCVENAVQLGKKYGVVPRIKLGNIETEEIGVDRYDVIVAESLLEHVAAWEEMLQKVHRALRPNGIFYFCSSNKFSFFSGEFRGLPLYSWLPDRTRRWIRTKFEGPDVSLWFMDLNQFTYGQLRRALVQVGFRDVFDYLDLKDPDALNSPTRWRRLVARALKSSRLAKHVALTFWPCTTYVCKK